MEIDDICTEILTRQMNFAKEVARDCFLLPFLSKFFFRADSVGEIEPTAATSCTAQIIPPAFPMKSVLLPKVNSIAMADKGSRTRPAVYHNFPQYLWAKFQVSMFFMDLLVRYPKTALMSFGGRFKKSFPKPIIEQGMSRMMINM